VRRGDEREPELRTQAHGGIDPQPLLIDRHRHQLRAAGDQAVACSDSARILEPNLLARVEQRRADQVESLLRTADNEQLLRVTADAAVGTQVGRQGPAQ